MHEAAADDAPNARRLETVEPSAPDDRRLATVDGDNVHAQPPRCRRLLLTLLFTDIVGSTGLLERLGDRAWHTLLHRHRAVLRTHLGRSDGVEVDCCGDGFFAIFTAPALAIQFAERVRHPLRQIGIEIRAGVHAGECELEAMGRVCGIAVHVAARIASLARPGEILVSDTVRDLVAGSGLGFADRGRRALKGVTGPRRLFALHRVAGGASPLVE
jgi:class 3 adenylate cyclase